MGHRPINMLLVLLALAVAAAPLRLAVVAPIIHAAESEEVARALNRLHSRHHVHHRVHHHAHKHVHEDGRTHSHGHHHNHGDHGDRGDHGDDGDRGNHEDPADHHCLLDHLPDAPLIKWTSVRHVEVDAPPLLPAVAAITVPASGDWIPTRTPKPPPRPPSRPRHLESIETVILRL